MTSVPVGGYHANAHDRPGMTVGTDTSTGVRHTGFLDAGVCSKTVRALPAMTKYFQNLRNALTGLHSQTKSNTTAINSLLQRQADINNETNLLNYWMRQVSPQLDKLNLETGYGNSALAGMNMSANSVNDSPSVPDALTLVPAPSIGDLMLYFARPVYTGNAALSAYEIVTFMSETDAMSWLNASDVITLAEVTLMSVIETAPWNTPGCDDMYTIYGSDLRVVTSHDASTLVGEVCIRIRAKNESNLWSSWSAPTLLCKAASTAAELNPFLDDIIAGCTISFVSWRVPMVQQTDKSYAIVGGIHSYMINGVLVEGGSYSAAQIALISGPVTVKPCTDEVGGVDVGESNVISVVIPTQMPAPLITVRLVNTLEGDTYAIVTCVISHDYYSITDVKYTVTATNITTNSSLVITGVSSNDVLTSTFTAPIEIRVPDAPGFLTPGNSFVFSATAEHATGTPHVSTSSPDVGPFFIMFNEQKQSKPIMSVTVDDTVVTSGYEIQNQNAVTKFYGRAEPNSTVTMYEHGAEIYTAVVDGAGNWAFTPQSPLTSGVYSYHITVTNAVGNISISSDIFTLTVDILQSNTPAMMVTINDNLITSGFETNGPDVAPTFSGIAELNSTVTLYDLYNSSTTLVGTATIEDDGKWSITLEGHLMLGSHHYHINVTTFAGNVSAPSLTFTLNVRTRAPTLTVKINNVFVLSPHMTKRSDVYVYGTSVPGSIVTLYDSGSVIANTVCNQVGDWSYLLYLSHKIYTLYATATDSSTSITSTASPSFDLTVDREKPIKPNMLVTVGDGDVVDSGYETNGPDVTPNFSGTAELNSTVTLSEFYMSNNTVIRTIPIDKDGKWTITLLDPLAFGAHTYSVTVTDQAGNVSNASNIFIINVRPRTPTMTVSTGTINITTPYGTNTESTVTFKGNSDLNTLVKLFDLGTLITVIAVNSSGTWEHEEFVVNGSHVFYATATDITTSIASARVPDFEFNVTMG